MVRGVDILKRPARAGERPWDCLKGTSVVCVPVHYVLAYINSLEYRGQWDELFLKGIFLQRINFMGCLNWSVKELNFICHTTQMSSSY